MNKIFKKKFPETLLQSFIFVFSTILILIEIASVFINSAYFTSFSPDSWALLDISKNIFHNFYEVTYIREFEYGLHRSISFPPLFPFVIAVLNKVFNMGIYAGYFVNFVILILTILLSLVISKKIFGFIAPGLLIGVMLVTNSGYLYELTGARTVPLSVLLFLILVLVLTKEKGSDIRKMIFSGIIAGLMVMNRFDFLIAGALLGFIFFHLKKSAKLSLLAYYVTFLIVIFPWIIYSYLYFGKLFVSDNQRTVFLAINNFTLDYFPNGINALPSLLSDPFRWIIYRGIYKGGFTFIFYIKEVVINYYINLSIWLCLITGALYYSKFLDLNKKTEKLLVHIKRKNFQILLILVLIQLLTVSLTGFLEGRYLSVSFVFFYIFYMYIALFFGKFILKDSILKLLTAALILLVCISNLTNVGKIVNAFDALQNNKIINEGNVKPDKKYISISKTLGRDLKKPSLLVHGKGEHSLTASKFSVLTNTIVLEPPGNVNEYTLVKQIENLKISHINTSCKYWLNIIRSQFVIQETSIEHIYYIKEKVDNRKELRENIKFDLKYRDCAGKL